MKRVISVKILSCLLLLAVLPFGGLLSMKTNAANEPIKQKVTYYTEEERQNILANVGKYSWVKAQRDSYAANAQKYIDLGYEWLWSLFTSQDMPRCYTVESPIACLSCDAKALSYSYNLPNDPWKLTCSKCGMKFPTNDFGKYYESSLDENGIFIPGKGDKQYLKNVLYPEKGESWGTDDGWGYESSEHRFMYASYLANCHWIQGRTILSTLYNAYLYTGEQKYADAAIIMLDRASDLYPDLDILPFTREKGFFFSDGGGKQGKIAGSISECTEVLPYLYAYDALFPAFETMSDEAMAFLKDHSDGAKKTYKDIMVNIENGMVMQIYPAVQSGKIRGNSGMHQRALALAAVVLDDSKLSKEWLDFVFRTGTTSTTKITGGNLSTIFVNDIDRDGFGNEAAPHYNSGWLGFYFDIANILDGYVIDGTDISYDLYENVKFRKMFYAMINLIVADNFTPNIGDTQYTGNAKIFTNLKQTLTAFMRYRDPYLAQAAHMLSGGNIEVLRLEATEKDPEAAISLVQEIIDKQGTLDLGSNNMTGYGLAVLQNENTDEETDSAPKSVRYNAEDIEILNEHTVSDPGALRADGAIKLTSKTATLTVYIDSEEAVYDISFQYTGDGASGKYNVYIDGKLAQAELELNTDAAKSKSAYMKKTHNLKKGLHYFTFEPTSESASATLNGIQFNKSSDSTGSSDKKSKTALTMYYGRNGGHGHNDNLNLGLYAYNVNITPDLGTPEVKDSTDMMRIYFVENVISHNTVMIDKTQQSNVIASEPQYYGDSEYVKVISVDASEAYPNSDQYKRTSALIKFSDDQSYAVDFFKVSGGNDHIYSFHSAESSDYTTTGLNLEKQTDASGKYKGTLFSPDVEWGGNKDKSGFQYFTNVRTDNAPNGDFSIDWKIVDTWKTAQSNDIHLKLHMLGNYDKVTLVTGTPPRNKTGNPSALEYVLVENTGTNTDSLYSAVFEPYDKGTNFIISTELCDIVRDGQSLKFDTAIKAIKVTLENGRTDYIICNTGDTEAEYTIDNRFSFIGSFAVVSYNGDEISHYAIYSSVVGEIKTAPRVTGEVTSFTEELSTNNYIGAKLDGDVNVEELAGKYVYIDNDTPRNASYRIISAEKTGAVYSLQIGDVTLIEKYKDSNNPSLGYIYDIEKGAKLYIPLDSYSGFSGTENRMGHISQATISHGIKSRVSAGEFIANIIPTAENAITASEVPEYTVSIDESYGDAKLFVIKDNKLYSASDIDSDGVDSYTIKLRIESAGSNFIKAYSIPVMSKSEEEKAIYSELPLKYVLPENTEKTDGETLSEKGSVPIGAIAAGIGVCAAAAGAAVISHRKKKTK